MLQYVLNVSVIWFSCLVLFDLLLKKETFHSYNRLYLLTSVMLGLVIPLIRWTDNSLPANSLIREPIVAVSEMKAAAFTSAVTSAVTTAASPANNSGLELISLENIIWMLYLAGCLVMTVVLVKEIIRLVAMFQTGKRSREWKFILIETNKNHSPFSFFNLLFVNSKTSFSNTEWQLLLQHENVHRRLFHSIDKIFFSLLKIAFWFNPLVYIFDRRLTMVQEFQADKTGNTEKELYGNFLIEQSMLQSGAGFTNSLNYSPIKNRITMLTSKESSAMATAKYSVLVPLYIILIICCTQNGFSAGKISSSNRVFFNGNEIELKPNYIFPSSFEKQGQVMQDLYLVPPDSVEMKNFSSGEYVKVPVVFGTIPARINGKDIFTANPGLAGKLHHASFAGRETIFQEYIFGALEADLNTLHDGFYDLELRNIVIDEKGRLAYYEGRGVITAEGNRRELTSLISADKKLMLDKKLKDLLEAAPKFNPAIMDGRRVPSIYRPSRYNIIVTNGHAVLKEAPGC
jgi:beta-lactamase regulating signal transducer with metallopeptidase domain